MFGMEDPVAGSSELTIMVVEHPSLAGVLKTAFDTTWERGSPSTMGTTASPRVASRRLSSFFAS